MKQKTTPAVKLIVEILENGRNACFERANKKYKMLRLSSPDVEEYYVLDHPIPESISGWIELEIIEHKLDNQETFELSYSGNGMNQKIVEILEELIQKAHFELNSGTNKELDLSPFLNLIGWIITME